MVIAVVTPLLLNTVANAVITSWRVTVEDEAKAWLSSVPNTEVTGVDVAAAAVTIQVRTPGELPPTAELLAALSRQLPPGITMSIATTLGSTVPVGTTERR
jgi:hypothetical protein